MLRLKVFLIPAESYILMWLGYKGVLVKNNTIFFSQFSLQIYFDNAKVYRGEAKGWLWRFKLSKKKIADDDMSGNLYLLALTIRKNKKILSYNTGLSPFQEVLWSKSRRYLALTQYQRSIISIDSLVDNKHKLLTSGKYNYFSPKFSADGKWIYFLCLNGKNIDKLLFTVLPR